MVWKLAQSPHQPELYCAPGNPGIAEYATCVEIAAEDVEQLLTFARNEKIDLTVVGPEAPLARGIVDRFQEHGLCIFGPTQEAAQIESSKAWAKQLMMDAGIPTAAYRVFSNLEEAKKYVLAQQAPIVLKADGLAAGKGVIVAKTTEEAIDALDTMMRDQAFGKAGAQVVVEQYLEGPEATIMAFVDGTTYRLMVPVQDHKPVFDGNLGPNTGGMGTYSPVPDVTDSVLSDVENRIIQPVLHALKERGIHYKGVLYTGIMLTQDGPFVIEFNARFGDPETQIVMPRLASDVLDIYTSIADPNSPVRLSDVSIEWKEDSAVCVVLAAKGYPGTYEKGQVITGIEASQSEREGIVFHAGTTRNGDHIVTNGGRVLGVTSLGSSLKDARKHVYTLIDSIKFDGMHFRTDIAKEAADRQ
jgi:phosphoribosylamine---glycine ligase